jgi:hypothetical protein
MRTYGFQFYEWPRAFALRQGWKHYLAYRNDKIVACRSFYMTKDMTVWSEVDAPVPGDMTSDCAPDFAIWKRAISDALRDGAKLFVADIELPNKENKDAYEGFKRLAFVIPYTRYHYRLISSNKRYKTACASGLKFGYTLWLMILDKAFSTSLAQRGLVQLFSNFQNLLLPYRKQSILFLFLH